MLHPTVEDVGLADPAALQVCVSARDAYHFLGSPEGELALAEACVYLAAAPKSNRVYRALGEAMRLTNARMGWELEEGRLSPADASAVKVYGTECLIEIYRLLVEVVDRVATATIGIGEVITETGIVAKKEEGLAPCVAAALERKPWMKALADDEIPKFPALGRNIIASMQN